MAEPVTFTLDGRTVTAASGETVFDVARREGIALPHLCHRDAPDYRPDGNCRACVVEVKGERALSASCVRKVAEGMEVETASPRASKAREMVFELLLADQPPRAMAHDETSAFWAWIERMGIAGESRLPRRSEAPAPDDAHPAIAVNLDACIACGLCVRACREVQVNDVIGMAGRGHAARPAFDQDDPLGASSCVACGECVAVCPTGALMPKAIIDADTGAGSRRSDRVVTSVCPFCGVGCRLDFHIRDERIAFVEGGDGPANRNRLCVKGRFGFDYIHSPLRLTRPLIRKPGAPKGINVNPANPFTHFREASWEEALDAAATGLARIAADHGGRAVSGFGSAKCSNEEAYLFQKLIRTRFGHNNLDHCTRLCHASSVAALMEGVGSAAVTATFNETENADFIIVIGANPTENHPVAATWFKQAAKRGATLVVMDPRGQALKRHATHMLQFRPGTDVALVNALMNVIVTEGLYDETFVDTRTEGFAALRAHLAPYTPEAMAPVTGISEATLRTVARGFATARAAMIFWGMGVSQHTHGTDNARCLISLAMIAGHVGRPGTGLHPLRGQNNVQGASDAGLIPMVLPDYARVGIEENRARFEALWQTPIDPQPGLTVVEILNAARAGDIRAMYILGENPAMSDPDAAHARNALASLEHLVVEDIFLTETAMFADVVLPAAAWPEKTGTVTNTNRQVQMGRPAVSPPGEAREDWAIVTGLARRLGLGWTYGSPAEVFAEMKQVMHSLDNITWERLETEGTVAYPCPAPDHPGEPVVFGKTFPTPSGRARLVPADVTDPAELPDADFPFVLTTGRQLEHWHTGAISRRSKVLDALEPGPTASIHPATLARLGVKPGDHVRVATRRGAIELAARADTAIQQDMVFIPFAYVEAAANLLTNPKLDPFGKIPEFKFCAARVEPAGGNR
ncbi:MAG: formate dehydrogenase subunit alpha [Hyphomicrobiales bacterium]